MRLCLLVGSYHLQNWILRSEELGKGCRFDSHPGYEQDDLGCQEGNLDLSCRPQSGPNVSFDHLRRNRAFV